MLGLAVHQRGDDVAKSGQRKVDLGRLLQSLTRSTRLGLALRTLSKDIFCDGQVD